MLKVKRITEEILPKSRRITDAEKELFKNSCNDGYIFYYSRHNMNEMFCLKCNHKFEIGVIEGNIHCPNCGNNNIRERQYRYDKKYIRSLEIIDGFFIIKDSKLEVSETMEGLVVSAKDIASLVIQENREFAVFENQNRTDIAQWKRCKTPQGCFLVELQRPPYATITLWVDNPAVYAAPMFSVIEKDLKTTDIVDLYAKLLRTAKINADSSKKCPNFDDSRIEHDTEFALMKNTLHNKVEYLSNNMFLLHTWCALCGRYAQKLFIGKVDAYSHDRCMACHAYGSSDMKTKATYFLTPQEFEDGSLLLRVDNAVNDVIFEEMQEKGVAPKYKKEFKINSTIYIYVTMDGKAHLFNSSYEQIDKTGITATKRKLEEHKFFCSEDHKGLILNNKAVKRTGFVEYAERSRSLDVRYFDAMQKVPSLETLSKSGLTRVVISLICAETKDIPTFLKKENGLSEKRLTKAQITGLKESNCSLSDLDAYMKVLKKDREASYDDFYWISSQSHYRHIIDVFRAGVPGMTVKKMREYLERVDEAQCCPVSESAQLWADYVRMLKDLDCDLTDNKLVFPNSLKREHDKASRKIVQVKDEKLNAAFKERAEQNDKYAWGNAEFKVLIPHELSDLYEEGRKLNHCVGTYGKVIANGRSVVAFVRKANAPDVPLCTLEIRHNEIVQASGVSNRPAENIPKMREFLKSYSKQKGLKYRYA